MRHPGEEAEVPNATMEREIRSQPEVLGGTLDPLRRAASALAPMEGGGTLWAGGCGDSLFAAQVAADLFGAAGLPFRAASALELGFMPGGPRPGDRVALISISGGTARAVEAARRLKARGVDVLAITCNAESALAQAADAVLALPYEPVSRKTPHTVDYLVSLQALAVLAEHRAGHRFAALDGLAEALATHLEPAFAAAAGLAEAGALSGRFFFLGGLGDYGSAGYGAAKLHEAGGQWALSAESENFVHGMNFMLSPDDLVVPVAGPHAAAFRARELAAPLGELAHCRPILAGYEALAGVHALANAPSDSVRFPFVAALYLQTLCHAVAVQRCPDVEAPRGGLAGGDRHADVQGRLMKGTRQVLD